MPIILTGDVHQEMGTLDQKHLDQSEASLTPTYCKIAAKYGLKVTLFFTARAIIENGDEAAPLLQMQNVEIGGHGWDGLSPIWWHRVLRVLTGSPHGPYRLQQRMIQRTCSIIEQFSGSPVKSWRNHAYRHDQNTPYLLHKTGIEVWSDKVEPQSMTPRIHSSGMTILPINVLPDHENMLHAERTLEKLPDHEKDSSYHPREWCDIVCEQAAHIINKNGIVTVLAHPSCMKIADNWQTFEYLCANLSQYPSLFAREIKSYIENKM